MKDGVKSLCPCARYQSSFGHYIGNASILNSVGQTLSLHHYYLVFVVLTYLAYLIAVNTSSYRSSLGVTDPGIQALTALDWLFGESEKHLLSSSIHQSDRFSLDRITTNLVSHLDMHKVRLIISEIHSNPGL
jgi:hypothetical protein